MTTPLDNAIEILQELMDIFDGSEAAIWDKAREFLEEYNAEGAYYEDYKDDMDGYHTSTLTSAGWGTDEDNNSNDNTDDW